MGGGDKGRKKIFKKLFSCVILRLYTEFQCHTMHVTGLKVCGGMVKLCGGVVCKPISS